MNINNNFNTTAGVFQTSSVENKQQKTNNQADTNSSFYKTSKLYQYQISNAYRGENSEIEKLATSNSTQDKTDEDIFNITSKYLKDNSFNNYQLLNSDVFRASYYIDPKDAEKAFQDNLQFGQIMHSGILKNINQLQGKEYENSIERANSMIASMGNNTSSISFQRDYQSYNESEKLDITKQSFINSYRLDKSSLGEDKIDSLFQEELILSNSFKKLGVDVFNDILGGSYIELNRENIIARGLSKTEWIEHLNNDIYQMNQLIKNDPDMNQSAKDFFTESIELHENILKDLKTLWEYGSTDIKS